MEIKKDTFVIIDYCIRLEDGSYVKGENGPVSLNFIVGYDQVLSGLERRLLGLEEGAAVEFVIPASEAFGEYDATQVYTKTFDEFPQGHSLEVGKWVVATNEQTQAQYGYHIRGKTEDTIALDFNHPLAGKDLHYQVKVTRVRPALKEELEYLRPCEHGDDSAPVGQS
jgi:FKBP-type peptidyl-prolyl cis-trans isomerase SlyD